MSKDTRHFVPDSFAGKLPGESGKFNLDPFVRESAYLQSGFLKDLEQQRDTETARVLESGEDVQEMFSDAMRKMKDQAEHIQTEAQEQGYKEGHEEGYQAGAREVRERFASSLSALQALVDELSQAREKLYPRLEREMVEMVAALAKKVVRTELEGKADGIREIVRMAVESALDREVLVVKVHPDDYRELQDFGQELIQLFHDIKNVEMQSHASVARGHCVVETNFGTVEAGLDHLDEQIERILHLAPPAPPPPIPQDEAIEKAGFEGDAGMEYETEEVDEPFPPSGEEDVSFEPDAENESYTPLSEEETSFESIVKEEPNVPEEDEGDVSIELDEPEAAFGDTDADDDLMIDPDDPEIDPEGNP